MNNRRIDYIKTLSDNKKIQEILIKNLENIFLNQKDFNSFIKENETKVIHIRDWVDSIIKNNEQWTNPRVLTLKALNNAADKYFEKKNNKIKKIQLNEKEEKLIIDLDNYYIVQMLTSESLDNESKQMQHCIGHGWYDANLKKQDYQYLSLRDKSNKAHVTIEIYENRILQLQGKQNKIPDDKYLEILLPWLMESNYENIPWSKINKFYENGRWINFKDMETKENIDYILYKEYENCSIVKFLTEKARVYFYFCKNFISVDNKSLIYTNINVTTYNYVDIFQYLFSNDYKFSLVEYGFILNKNDNKIYSIYNLPNNCEINNDLYLNSSKIKKLPDNLVINGFLNIDGCKNLNCLPNGLVIKKSFSFRQNFIKEIPDDIKIGGYLRGNFSKLEKLPENLIVNSFIDLKGCTYLTKLPDNLHVNGYLDIQNTGIEKLPKGLFVKGLLVLSKTNIKELPDDISLNYGIDITSSNIEKLPDKLNCDLIKIDENQIHLIKESMDFNYIAISSFKKRISKIEFFKRRNIDILNNN